MLFSSMSFVFVFLPIVLLIYYICKSRNSKNTVLLASSILFYAWGEPKYLLVMLISIIITWGSAILISSRKNKKLF